MCTESFDDFPTGPKNTAATRDQQRGKTLLCPHPQSQDLLDCSLTICADVRLRKKAEFSINMPSNVAFILPAVICSSSSSSEDRLQPG